MNSTVMQTTVQLNDEMKQQLTGTEKETVATDGNTNHGHEKRPFTAAEMWNAQRKKRSASDLMRRWTLN